MALISDIFLASGAFAAALYCYVLSRKLARFAKLETGMGGAIAVLSAQVDDLTRALAEARGTAAASSENLAGLTARAESVAGRIELLLASLNDLPEAAQSTSTASMRTRAAQADPMPAQDESRKLRFTRHRSRRTDPLILSEAAE